MTLTVPGTAASSRPSVRREEAKRLALTHARELVRVAGRDSFDLYAARRQFLRYPDWFALLMDQKKAERVMPMVRAILGELDSILA